MHKSSDIQYKTDFISRVAATVGEHELAIAMQVSLAELNKKISGLVSINDSEIEQTYKFLCELTKWEQSHV